MTTEARWWRVGAMAAAHNVYVFGEVPWRSYVLLGTYCGVWVEDRPVVEADPEQPRCRRCPAIDGAARGYVPYVPTLAESVGSVDLDAVLAGADA